MASYLRCTDQESEPKCDEQSNALIALCREGLLEPCDEQHFPVSPSFDVPSYLAASACYGLPAVTAASNPEFNQREWTALDHDVMI